MKSIREGVNHVPWLALSISTSYWMHIIFQILLSILKEKNEELLLMLIGCLLYEILSILGTYFIH